MLEEKGHQEVRLYMVTGAATPLSVQQVVKADGAKGEEKIIYIREKVVKPSPATSTPMAKLQNMAKQASLNAKITPIVADRNTSAILKRTATNSAVKRKHTESASQSANAIKARKIDTLQKSDLVANSIIESYSFTPEEQDSLANSCKEVSKYAIPQ